MRLLSARLIISLIVGITLVSLCTSYYQVLVLSRGMRGDLERRAQLLGESLSNTVERDLQRDAQQTLQRTVQQFANREHLAGLAVYDRQGHALAVSTTLQPLIASTPEIVQQSLSSGINTNAFLRMGISSIHITALPLYRDSTLIGCLAIVHDSGYIRAESLRIWRETFLSALAHVVLIVLITLLIVRWSIAGPIARTARWMKALRTGRAMSPRMKLPDLELFRPIAREVATFAESLNTARSAAELEARLRVSGESTWTADRLAVQVLERLEDGKLFVVSNREPYIHVHRGKSIAVDVPASGLVTALEPVLRACGGTWVAHGSGDADTETVDSRDRLPVPPDDPRYTLRRVWLTKEEEQGYYYGFANEGLWPLCHIAHTRPLFRASGLAALPGSQPEIRRRLARRDGKRQPSRRPRAGLSLRATSADDQAEAARRARRDLLAHSVAESGGLRHLPLAARARGRPAGRRSHRIPHPGALHQFSANRGPRPRIAHRLESVFRAAAGPSHDGAAIPHQRRVPAGLNAAEPPSRLMKSARQSCKPLGVSAALMGVGVDRLDYTKGILERFLAIERFLEKYPRYQGVFTFVQIGAPSRTHIKRYRDLQEEVEAEADRINWRFQADQWKPIVLLNRQHSHKEVEAYYRAADLCLVTALHDGMNLVAKEFVATRQDERGVLILSCFTGAARELCDALQVNPYDIDQTAEALRAALEMPPEEKQLRMQRMRKLVRENNVYRWAGSLIDALCDVRLDSPESSSSTSDPALFSDGGARDATRRAS